MTYSVIGLLAIVVHCIVNVDIFRKGKNKGFPAERDYLRFLICVLVYHLNDVIWGLLYERRLSAFVYADTVVYFVTMALSVVLWTRYALRYLGGKSRLGKAIYYVGQLFFVFQIGCLIANAFTPVFFYLDESGAYHACVLRYAAFMAQIVMHLITAVYSFVYTAKSKGTVKRRHLTIGLFGLAMILAIAAQVFFPLYPFYSIGYLLGCCVIHTFVMEDEKEESAKALQDALDREREQYQELAATKRLVRTDPLTGLKSKYAYAVAEEKLERRMAEDKSLSFAIAVFDLNDLKNVNDTKGHRIGDEYIATAGKLIKETFNGSSVYRIGGDEFVTILEGENYESREALMAEFRVKVDKNMNCGRVVVSSGIAEYIPGADNSVKRVFSRADEDMYRYKRFLKENKVGGR